MSHLYLVRHGHTQVADSGIVAGFNDVELSKKGKASLVALKKSLNTLHFDRCYTSDLIRTHQSFELLCYQEYSVEPRLKELNFGDWEGMSWSAVHQQYPEKLNTWSENWIDNRPPNGETFYELSERCASWLSEQPRDDTQSLLVLAHGGSIRALLCAALQLPLSSAMQFEIDHASVTKLILSEQGNRCVFVNRSRFDREYR